MRCLQAFVSNALFVMQNAVFGMARSQVRQIRFGHCALAISDVMLQRFERLCMLVQLPTMRLDQLADLLLQRFFLLPPKAKKTSPSLDVCEPMLVISADL